MPGYVIHLAVAKEYIKKHKNQIEDEDKYIQGVIYPDSVKDKSITHYGEKSSKVILRKFLLENEINTSFNKGYFIHLITDYLFYNKFLNCFSQDIYNDYDVTNKFLIEKYNLEIPDSIKENIFFKKGKSKLFSIDSIIKFIEKTSDYNIYEIKDQVLKDSEYWNSFRKLKKLETE